VRNSCLIQDAAAGGWWHFRDAVEIVAVPQVGGVVAALDHVERRVNEEGLWAAGFVAYGAGPAFDPSIEALHENGLPLLWMGLFPKPQLVALPLPAPDKLVAEYRWQPSVTRPQYDEAIARIRSLIAAGDIYQVNYTMRLRSAIEEDPQALFLRMIGANDALYGAYLDCGDFVFCSASPELFFRLDGENIASRPMKGTAARGLTNADDRARAQQLSASEKDRAENVMIVDMVRNDLGRIAQAGSVKVSRLFELERYPTLWQMTSTVEARTRAPVSEILRALFPPASITGAPKIRATQVIADSESTARGVYTGCIGYIAPHRQAQFNVAIRTAVIDRNQGAVEYGLGSGIVWDSRSAAEYDECLLKARIVTAATPAFELLETLLWEAEGGYFLLAEHLRRLADSADYFDMPVNIAAVRSALSDLAATFPREPRRVRLMVDDKGRITCESVALSVPAGPVRLALAAAPIDASDPFLYNKTTQRKVYDDAKAARADCDDVILWNADGEITETTIANLVVELNGEKFTPPVECGLLAGVFRGFLLATGEIGERRMNLEDLHRASRIWTINSVRKWREAALVNTKLR
jgi:para-aminobenzoate synthetase / 4-amino-4-deoxychorismate lyase